MFRFTIRDLIWLTALAAIALGCWRYHVSIIARLHEEENARVKAAESENNQQLQALNERHAIDNLIQRLEERMQLLSSPVISDERRTAELKETEERFALLLKQREAMLDRWHKRTKVAAAE